LTELKSLSLDFGRCLGQKLTTAQALSSSLTKLNSLRQLDLCLYECLFLDDESIIFLIEGLQALKDLTDLSIDLRNPQEGHLRASKA